MQVTCGQVDLFLVDVGFVRSTCSRSLSFGQTMTATAPLAQGHALNVPTHQRVTRSASNLRKQIQPTSPANSDDDEGMHDEVVLAPLPSRSQDGQLSSQTRRQLARPGSSTLDERVSDADGVAGQALSGAEHGRGSSWYGSQDESMEADAAAGVEDEELDDEDDGEEDQEEEDSDAGDDSRSEGELQAIGAEMDALEQAVPGLLGKYHLTDRLGEGAISFSCAHLKFLLTQSILAGTFSSVYKAIDLQNRSFDNSQWKPVERKGKVYVAVKRIYVTSSPVRIHNELEILHDLRSVVSRRMRHPARSSRSFPQRRTQRRLLD